MAHVFAVDLHVHTRFFHSLPGRPTPFDPLGAVMVALYGRWRNLDDVALTDHDYYRNSRVVPGDFRSPRP